MCVTSLSPIQFASNQQLLRPITERLCPKFRNEWQLLEHTRDDRKRELRAGLHAEWLYERLVHGFQRESRPVGRSERRMHAYAPKLETHYALFNSTKNCKHC